MIAIVKYDAGNITSVKNALYRLGCDAIVTDNVTQLQSAEKVIFPGVGNAGFAMQNLQEKKLDAVIKQLTQPVLGVCVGLQLLCAHSEEEDTECLGIFNTKVKLFPANDIVPHMGWNNCEIKTTVLLNGITAEDNFYFVHSYYAELNAATVASCNYIETFSAVMQQNNFYAAQFHPEKSGKAGELFLQNFLNL
jgi:imidazole glycerol-phosphate synthase subunit HisH